ncbi:MAG: hypothetical protein IJ459_03855 [Clostridia bacterium]|nr:hypothetical protein [Clostridia bacterium]
MKKNTIKLRTEGGKWYVDEGYKVSIFDTSKEAWQYIFVLREIRPKAPWVPQSQYPVRHLNPMPTRGCKKVVLQNR